MAVSDWAGSVSNWRAALESMKAFIAPAFKRLEQRVSAGAFIDGLLSGVERKTGWMLAEEAGLARPYQIQSLLGRSRWSADGLCDRVRSYALETLGDPDEVLVIDETGFLKKGVHSVGVSRQYSGTAGRIENCQIGVFAANRRVDAQPSRAVARHPPPAHRVESSRPQSAPSHHPASVNIPAFAAKPQCSHQTHSRHLPSPSECSERNSPMRHPIGTAEINGPQTALTDFSGDVGETHPFLERGNPASNLVRRNQSADGIRPV